MKFPKPKRILAALLALTALFSLAACGNAQTKTMPESTPEYVYHAEFEPLDRDNSGDLYICFYNEDGAYANAQEKTGREIPEGGDVENMTEEELEHFDVYSTCIYFIKNNGTMTKLDEYTPLEGYPNDKGYKDYYSESDLRTMAMGKNGELIAIEDIYTGYYDGPEGKNSNDEDYYDYYKSSQEMYIRTLDAATGAEIKSVKMDFYDEQYMRPTVAVDSEGNLITAVDSMLVVYNSEGEIVDSTDCGYAESIFTLKDGTIYVTAWDDAGNFSLAPYDETAHVLGKSVPLPEDAYSPIAGNGEYDLFYTSGLSFCGYDLESGEATTLFNWINLDVNNNDLRGVRVDENGDIHAFVLTDALGDNNYKTELLTVTKVPYDPASEKETLTLACLSLSSNLQDAVLKFNRDSTDTRIEIKDYSYLNTDEDYNAGAQKLITEMLSGDVADIVSLENLPYRRIASKGLLEDLYPYLDTDKELKRKDFFQNVMSSLEVNDKLYCVCPSFYVATVLGAKSVVGDKTSWTYEEFNEALSKMPEGCKAFEAGATKDAVLNVCLGLDMQDFVNWDTGECNFESQQFIKLLEFVNTFPAEYTDADEEVSQQELINSRMQMLLTSSIYSMDDVLYDQTLFGGQEVSYIGFPTYSGGGNVLNIEGSFAMSKDCKNKDAAWEFLRSFLTENYQQHKVWSIPTNLAAYDNKLAELMKVKYQIDDNGQYVLDENGERIKEPRYTMSMDDGPTVNIYAMSQEQADLVTELVKGATKAFDFDQSIIDIVTEQAQAYFAGQKTAEEVAKLVQAKANIYVNEQG